jgi:hypothetical protein
MLIESLLKTLGRLWKKQWVSEELDVLRGSRLFKKFKVCRRSGYLLKSSKLLERQIVLRSGQEVDEGGVLSRRG